MQHAPAPTAGRDDLAEWITTYRRFWLVACWILIVVTVLSAVVYEVTAFFIPAAVALPLALGLGVRRGEESSRRLWLVVAVWMGVLIPIAALVGFMLTIFLVGPVSTIADEEALTVVGISLMAPPSVSCIGAAWAILGRHGTAIERRIYQVIMATAGIGVAALGLGMLVPGGLVTGSFWRASGTLAAGGLATVALLSYRRIWSPVRQKPKTTASEPDAWAELRGS